MSNNSNTDSVRQRLLSAAKDCFLSDDYHRVSTRMIAEQAGANPSMIAYYFGNKEGLYEEMIRAVMPPLLDVLDNQSLSSIDDIASFLNLYYQTMTEQPEFPKLILKVLVLNQSPGRRFMLPPASILQRPSATYN